MKKLTSDLIELQSMNITEDNISKLNSLFPEAFNENGIDFDILKQLLGENVDNKEERYGLNWHGKRQARQLALTPSRGTLRPCKDESVDWHNTKNLMIEGDNLEVLKLLQKSYAGKVKLIYIDPPYNTGKDFVYSDNFQDNMKNYLEMTGQTEDGVRITTNAETSGRYHTDWLNMIFPRLKLAKNLLSKDGVIFISLDDVEMPKLRILADEIFGEENFLANFIWKSRQNKDNRTTTGASIDHEYIICYGKKITGDLRDSSQYSNPDHDERGDWASANMVGIATAERRPNLHYDLINPETGINYGCPSMGWRYEPKTMNALIEEKRILWPKNENGRPRRKAFISELDSDFTGLSTLIGDKIFTKHGTEDIDNLFNMRVFDFPKPVSLLKDIITQGMGVDDIVLDFFAGSGTTAHSVMKVNAEDNGRRKFILVQLPEVLSDKNRDQKTASDFCDSINKPRNIAELTKERLRRAGKKVQEDNPDWNGDVGFRVFKLDTSNIRPWEATAETLSEQIDAYVSPILEGRSEEDLLTELMLKRGIDLSVNIEIRQFDGLTVSCVDGGKLFICFAKQIPASSVEELTKGIIDWHKSLKAGKDTVCYFLDDAFENNIAKTNLCAILEQHGLTNLHSL
ncbi:site-specific DNA-methyltransferase [Pluralibacter gergoviae]|uniref:site-specific DNA-methyltransferase n=1 Tax=Pluralibacter gergoviae TaxID=61647 RepID=UPI0006512078|nr:site-specific DNA-methyltransferase [Pluralibacter gergoviae]KMK25969.1 DNA methyltransferase [Pluralibacter gergoviae]